MSKVAVIGAGAAGMMAAVTAARAGHNVTVYEKNEKAGKKLYITGKGRCNLTNACDMETLFSNIMTNQKFLYSAFYSFSNLDTMAFFENLGLEIKVERGERVFPASDKSSDVISSLTMELKKLGVDIRYHSIVKKIEIENNQCRGLITKAEGQKPEAVLCDACIIATGGLSYPSTGSTGDGYRFAKELGHKVKPQTPSLVPVEIKEDIYRELQGLSLKNIRIRAIAEKKEIFSDFGEMLFTHFGISGPVILSASSYLIPYLEKAKELLFLLDLKPALSYEALDQRILMDFKDCQNKQFANSLDGLLPKKLIPVIISLSSIDPHKQVNAVTREERNRLVTSIKEMKLTVKALRGYNEAVITKGGVNVKEINPSTMESLLVKGVYFAGELLDTDALTGGFNLQIAWSTGYAAGSSVT